MIQIKSNRAVAFFFDAVKIGVYFGVIFYAAKTINSYILDYLGYMVANNLTADLSSLLFVLSMVNKLFEYFIVDLVLVLAFMFIYTLQNKYIFSNGFLYCYKGILFVKERTIPFKNIREMDYDKTVFDTGNIIIRLHEEEKPVIIPYVSKVMERFEEIKKETGFDKDDKERVFKQVQGMEKPGRPVKSQG